jgi:hypothetical protein
VFTAGIGEHDAIVRARVCQQAAWLGAELDPKANAHHGPRISGGQPDGGLGDEVRRLGAERVVLAVRFVRIVHVAAPGPLTSSCRGDVLRP